MARDERLNDTNDKCRGCGGPTESLAGSGRAKWCPRCEGVKPPEPEEKPKKKIVASSDETDEYGFHIIEIDDEDLKI